MEENTQVETAPVAEAQESPQATQESGKPESNLKYVGFFPRLGALLIDSIAFSLVAVPLGLASFNDGTVSYGTTGSLAMMAYYVIMTAQFGATLGKMVFKIKVQSIETGKNLSFGSAFLREVIGKFISAIVIFLGFFNVIWDKKKQGWHDKIAKSVVVKK